MTAPKVFRPHPVVLNRTGLPLPAMIPSGTPMTPQTRLSAACFVSVRMQRTGRGGAGVGERSLLEVNPLENCKPSRTFVEFFPYYLLSFQQCCLEYIFFFSLQVCS